MKYCSTCGNKITATVPEGDDRERYVCTACGAIFYDNPKLVVGCIPVWEDKILLCRRAIEPRSGFWTLPAGFMENGETMAQGAIRETYEEANAVVLIRQPYRFYDIPHIHQVYGFFLADLSSREYSPGAESLEVALLREDQIPWNELAFPVMTDLLESYFSDVKSGGFNVEVSNRYVYSEMLHT